jgi:hypothetical protein
MTRGRGRSRRWPAAAKSSALRRRQGRQKGRAEEQRHREEEGGKNEAEDYFAKPKKHRDFTEKSL